MKSNFLYFFPFLVISLLFSCTENKNTSVISQDSNTDTISEITNPYVSFETLTSDDSVDVKLYIEKIDNEYFNLLIQMNLYGDTWIVSPLEMIFPYGIMTFDVDKNEHFIFIESIIENPTSVNKNDINLVEPYKVISKKTTLTQKIKLLSNENFEVSGRLFFILEPICTPNELNFKIINESGTLTILETNLISPLIKK